VSSLSTKGTTTLDLDHFKKSVKEKNTSSARQEDVSADSQPETAPPQVLNEPAEDKAVDPKELQDRWFEFATEVKGKGKDMWFSMLNQEVELMEDGVTIKMALTNPVLVDKVEEFRPELMQYLKEKLQNSHLMLKPVLEQAKASARAYTDEEKFRKLAEKYPYLLELKSRLGLDFT
jgi:DNA polymerase-3 subunit gamma/tau